VRSRVEWEEGGLRRGKVDGHDLVERTHTINLDEINRGEKDERWRAVKKKSGGGVSHLWGKIFQGRTGGVQKA